MTRPHWTTFAKGAAKGGRSGMNRTEAAYHAHLELRKHAGEVAWFGFHCFKLKLADSTWFEPDFLVMLAGGELQIHETKGFMAEKAWVKLKVAAEMFPIRVVVVKARAKKDGGGWDCEPVGDTTPEPPQPSAPTAPPSR